MTDHRSTIAALGPIATIDYHTAGEPFRIVAEPPMAIAGATVAERRTLAIADPVVDGVRRLLCFEPRGHADMYGCFVVPPDDDGADLGALFWHKDGFSTACGHGTIALGVWAVESGLVTAEASGTTEVRIDVPSGRVSAVVEHPGDRLEAVRFLNVPSYVLHRGIEVSTARGPATVDVSFGGAIYAQLPAADVGLTVTAERYGELIAIGREIKHQLDRTEVARHPSDDRLSGIYGTILFDELPDDANGDLRQRNVTVFADGEVDRSPCGSGTCARLAVLAADGRLGPGRRLRHDSIVGTGFVAEIAQRVVVEGRSAVMPVVAGTAHRTGRHVFELDPHDPLGEGFVLR